MSERDFDFWWTVEGEWVEEPNRRRSGWSGMMRVRLDGRVFYVKRQLNHRCRTLSHPRGWPTASREWHYLHRLARIGVAAPVPVFHDVRRSSDGHEAVLVTEELLGFVDLAGWTGLEPPRRRRLAQSVGAMLGRLHRAHLQHSSLYDKHVMAREEGDGFAVALIDLEKMRPRLLARRGAARRDLDQLRRRQSLFDDDDWTALLAAHEAQFSRA
ncbi:lipopolysaccharide kinase InaA family protein [Pseudazoarcus pumilus]|uniref:InaA protein n=1 Tax=Pseudazoarcus pumilus TaxID=2067960 RepID=A0A2I6S592_9RHOO|nr:lipopolysaccharide kinase InaA family protein [Pseudazoarcus pumilus]AUN94424.1 InaA protein [Pseudazoarcus pumilus]